LLGDHHSFYRKPNNTGNILNPNPPPGCGVATVPDASVPADIGYVRIPAFNGDNVAEVNLATSLHARIAAQDRSDLAGWIVDVRGNGGGDMWPMIAGVGPILGDGTAGYFISVTGTTPWGYNGVGSFDGTFVAVRPDPVYRLIAPNPRVAVLTNEGVASSGEAVVVAFRGRPNTRSFGARTCGVPTSNAGHTLSDGAVLFVTDAVDGDRNRNRYDSPIFPDEPIADSSTTVDRAIQWLRGG
jgi:C-terminal processing protease CtpA/Prc